MPTYDYKCNSCGKVSTVIQSIKDDPLTTCQECGGQIRRLISGGSGMIFKGSGFYITDYVKNPQNKSGSKIKEKETTSKTDSGSSDKSNKSE